MASYGLLESDLEKIDAQLERIARAKATFMASVKQAATVLQETVDSIGTFDDAALWAYVEDGVAEAIAETIDQLETEKGDLSEQVGDIEAADQRADYYASRGCMR